MKKPAKQKIIILIQCEDKKGILAATSTWFAQRSYNILHCQQHSDERENRYFMRLELDMEDLKTSREELEEEFGAFARYMGFQWQIIFSDQRKNVAILVSKTSHCLYDLLEHQTEGDLPCKISMIIGNHPTLENVAAKFDIPFHCLPVDPENKAQQEQQVLKLLDENDIDLVVLARYMQILSPEFIRRWEGRVINIHHGFLPAFQGANPYLRAYERGVKMIGATAHYASEDLDQGPIIEQDVVRVNHELTPDGLKEVGKEIERRVLSRAVQAHLEGRIIIFNHRTVVFDVER